MSPDDVEQTIKNETVLSLMVCRICATEQPEDCLNNLLTSIHDGHNGHRLYFVDMLQECLQRSIARDGFPLSICVDCTANLIVVYNFRLLCNDSEKKFRELLSYQSDPGGLEQKVEVTIDETDCDVKPLSHFIDCAAIDVLSTNCDNNGNNDRDSEADVIEPEAKPRIKKIRVQRYECYLCKRTFRTMDRLRKHITNYHNVQHKLWSCSDCHKRFSQRNKLVEHFYKHISTKCEHCSCDAFTTLRDLRKHYQQTHSDQLTLHPCNRCPKKFVLKAQLRIHMHNHLDSLSKKFNCNMCSDTFLSGVQLKGHIRAFHTTYLCQDCGKTFKNNSLLMSHQKTHNSEKPFVCSKCPSRFKWKVALTYHMTIHQQDRKHVCETCGMSFTTRSAMRGHMSKSTSFNFFFV